MSAFLEDKQIMELIAAARVPKHLQQGGSGGLGKGPGGGKKKRNGKGKGKGKNGGGPNLSRMPGISPAKKAPQKLPVLPPSGRIPGGAVANRDDLLTPYEPLSALSMGGSFHGAGGRGQAAEIKMQKLIDSMLFESWRGES